ncbi:MAG: hypothetical protein RBR08_02770 [Desulforegulaceae bacterium]|nr:hypothetical protein [Desulforegulaceae bacterium]
MSGEKRILKNGIWIKEQNGLLTMGLLDKKDFQVEIGEKTSLQLFALELEMQEALFGGNAVKFNPENVNFERLVRSLIRDLKLGENEISAHFSGLTIIKADYDLIYNAFKLLFEASVRGKKENKIYINASVVDKSLCVVYRDEVLCKKEDGLEEAKKIVEKDLNGKIKINDSLKNPFMDITIPENI